MTTKRTADRNDRKATTEKRDAFVTDPPWPKHDLGAQDRVVVDLKADKALAAETTALQARAAAIVVDSVDACRSTKVFLAGVQALRKKIVAHYDEVKRPINDLRKTITDMEKRDLDPVVAIERRLMGLVYDFEAAEERKRRAAAEAERERLRIEEEARRRREAEALRQQAEATKNRIDKSALKQQAAAIEAAPAPELVVPVQSVKAETKIADMSQRTTWAGDVVDFKYFVKMVAEGRAPIEALEINRSWLNKQAVALQDKLGDVYPGLAARSSVTYVSRG